MKRLVALVCRNRTEAAVFASLTMLAHLVSPGPQGSWLAGAEYQWWVLVLVWPAGAGGRSGDRTWPAIGTGGSPRPGVPRTDRSNS
jgi:hypothetical protein